MRYQYPDEIAENNYYGNYCGTCVNACNVNFCDEIEAREKSVHFNIKFRTVELSNNRYEKDVNSRNINFVSE